MLRQREHSQNLKGISLTTSSSPSSPDGSSTAKELGETDPIGVGETADEPKRFESCDPAISDRMRIGCSDEKISLDPSALDVKPCCCVDPAEN
jgi:hypothetical protein